MKVTHKESNKNIKILDSLQLFNTSLTNLLKSFNCDTQKGIFPYKFININSIYYSGLKPSKLYYNSITDKDYADLPVRFNTKDETLKYLTSDVKGLYEALSKYSLHIFNTFSINITNYFTLPSLAKSI